MMSPGVGGVVRRYYSVLGRSGVRYKCVGGVCDAISMWVGVECDDTSVMGGVHSSIYYT